MKILSAYIDAARDSAIIVTRNGEPEQGRERVRAGRSLISEQFWRELRRRRARRGTARTSRSAKQSPA